MAVQNDNTILNKGDLKAYHQKILPYLGGNFMMSTNNSEYYSTDEKIVGVWTDGKPLYQKTIVKNNTIITGITVHGISDIENIAKVEILFNNRGVFQYATNTLLYNSSAEIGFAVSADATNIYIKNLDGGGTNWDADTNRTWYFTLNYTKTTDTASSALTTPGAYDINFPYTWPVDKEIYFGNGVYGKRNVRTTTTATNTQYVIQTGVSKIVDCGGTQWRTGDGYGHPMAIFPGGTAYPYFYIKGATMSGGTGELSIWGATVTMQGWDVWATYTK